MSQITLSFASFAALAAAISYLEKTPGLVIGAAASGNVVSQPALTAPTAPTAAAAPAGAPVQSQPAFAASAAPTITFETVRDALMAYNAKDANAFNAAMQKFGFTSFEAIQAAPDKWHDVMTYIGAVPGAAPAAFAAAGAPTFDQVKRVLETWAKVSGAQFAQAMQGNGLTSIEAVQARQDLWVGILAAAASVGIQAS